MACAPEWVTAYVDGELGPGPREMVEQHLSGCRGCSEQVGAERLIRRELRALCEPRLPPALAALCAAHARPAD
jgi:anti-sigma factor RsiW